MISKRIQTLDQILALMKKKQGSSQHGLIVQVRRNGRFVSLQIQLLLDHLENQFLEELRRTMP